MESVFIQNWKNKNGHERSAFTLTKRPYSLYSAFWKTSKKIKGST